MRNVEPLIEPLTRRELEILALLAEQRTNKEIAACLSLSVNSVKWYARQIYGKLGVENRRQAVAQAKELGLLAGDTADVGLRSESSAAGGSLSAAMAIKATNNLPLQLTSLVGRGEEIEQLKVLSGSSRLVTLTGAGGVGKTRLALAVATQLLENFSDGTWLVELAPIGNPEIIAATIASIFGVRADQNRSVHEALIDYLRGKHLLLILDNCEHLIDACAEIAETILRTCPQVSILATSREALGLGGEATFSVPSLPFPEPGKLPEIDDLRNFGAVQLFVERARQVLPSYSITEANVPSLAQICQRLDGIPLALELAAARLQMLSLEQIAGRLDDRFRLLTGGSRRALPRHQTLHALIDWSYELLTLEERTLFRRLSVFAGGWTLQAAEFVCANSNVSIPASGGTGILDLSSSVILDLLGELIKKSLITVEREGDEVRSYHMLETIRQYAQEKLVEAGEVERLRDRHLDYFLALSEQSEPLLRGPQVLILLERLDRELGNLRLALSWGLGGEDDDRLSKGLRLGSALAFYWLSRRILDEGTNWLKVGLEKKSQNNSNWIHLRAKVLFAIGLMVINTLDFSKITEVLPLLEECISLFKECNDPLDCGLAQCMLGAGVMSKYITSLVYADSRVEYPGARNLGFEGLMTCRELGKPTDLSLALVLCMLIFSEGMEFERARAFGDEALGLCEKVGDKLILGITLMRMGSLAMVQGDLDGARGYIRKGLLLAQELKDKSLMLAALSGMGQIDYFSHDFVQMEDHFRGCLELSQALGALIYQMFSLRNLGIATLRQGDLKRSREYCLENLSNAQKVGWVENDWAKYDVYTFIIGMAGIGLEIGQAAMAARLLGAGEMYLETFFKPLDPWDQAEFERISGQVRCQLDEATFTSAWISGRELPLEQAIAEAQQISA